MKTYIGTKSIPVYAIEVAVLDNEQDWAFVWVDKGDGIKQMAIF